MKGKKNFLILFFCVFIVIIVGLFVCICSVKEIILLLEYVFYVNVYIGGVIF